MKKVVFYSVLILIQLFVIEICCRMACVVQGYNFVTLFPNEKNPRFLYDAQLNYKNAPGYKSLEYPKTVIASDGSRFNPLLRPQQPNILAMGGSTTFDILVSDEEAWPIRLQENLSAMGKPYNVVNLGVVSQHSNHDIARLPYVIQQYAPKLIVFYMDVNDICLFMQQDLKKEPRDPMTFSGAAGERYDSDWLGTIKIGKALLRRVLHKRVTNDNSHMVNSAKWFPDAAVLDHYRKNMATIIAICRAHQVQPVFIIPPYIHRPDIIRAVSQKKVFFGKPVQEFMPWIQHYPNWRPAQQAVIREFADQPGVMIIDLSSLYYEQIKANVNMIEEYYGDSSHFRAPGSAIFGKEIARHLKSVL